MIGEADLLDEPAPYDAARFPAPRAFQDNAHVALRTGAKAGHKRQIVMAPTGAGKTYLGLRAIHEALMKSRRALFLCDRITLITQTSETADRYGLISHGIMQADHWRFHPSAPFQIASAQTLMRRRWPDDLDLLVVDECHTQLKVWTDFIQSFDGYVLGLSATPFSKGLGKLFTNLVNAATMAELVDLGVLVPLRVFSCTKADMKDAATSGGEWTEAASAERGLAIVGDVVSEWSKYAENRKTIVFGATIAHCEEICRQFNESGVMAAVFCATTTPSEREAILKEYRRPDSAIRVLVSVSALSKGFDVPDVGCIVDCRPLRKSLSEFIQLVGRGLRSSPETGKTDCLAVGTLVLTNLGEVPIERITLDHKLWDGCSFVSHSGAVCKGVQRVIEYDGLIATPDHEVMTDDGWKRLEETAGRGLRITRTGVDGRPVRFAGDRGALDPGERLQPSRGGEVRQMRGHALRPAPQHPQATEHGGVPALQCSTAGDGSEVAVRALPGPDAEVQKPVCGVIREVWGEGHRVPLPIGEYCGDLGRGEPGDTGPVGAAGQDSQRRALRARESSLGNSRGEHEQHQGVRGAGEIRLIPQVLSAREVCGRDVGSDAALQDDGRRDRASVAGVLAQTEREVWDVLNAGPLQRFTANGRLVHNCILLDHSGNIVRFADDFSDIYFNGLTELDSGEKLDKTIRQDGEEKDIRSCPKCGYSPFGKRCISCGYEPPRAPTIEHEASGGMREIMIGKTKAAEDRRDLWNQICTYSRRTGKPDTAKGRAAHLYKDIMGAWPPDYFGFESAPEVSISKPLMGKIQSRRIAWAKGLAGRGRPA